MRIPAESSDAIEDSVASAESENRCPLHRFSRSIIAANIAQVRDSEWLD
jgi:hypothetical protein